MNYICNSPFPQISILLLSLSWFFSSVNSLSKPTPENNLKDKFNRFTVLYLEDHARWIMVPGSWYLQLTTTQHSTKLNMLNLVLCIQVYTDTMKQK